MLEKLNKVQVTHIIALIIVCICSYLAVVDKDIRREYVSMCLVGVVGWAFTRQKNKVNE